MRLLQDTRVYANTVSYSHIRTLADSLALSELAMVQPTQSKSQVRV